MIRRYNHHLIIISLLIPTTNAFIPKCNFLPSSIQQRHSFQSISSSSSSDILSSPPAPSPNSFAGMVERQLTDQFDSPTRVITSWRLLNADYEHHEFVGPFQNPPIPNPESSHCHQQAHSYVPDLHPQTFWNTDTFEWCQKLQSRYDVIKREFTTVLSNQNILSQGNNIWRGAVNEAAADQYGTGWKTLVLMNRGIWDPTNCNIFPETARAVHEAGVPALEVFFARMDPQSSLNRHSDNVNFVLTCHLPLVVPQNGENKCRLSVGDDTKQWMEGEVMLFDTSIMHDAVNETDEMRYILMMRVWHPDLTDVERKALQFTFDALNVPEIVSDDKTERFFAEQQLKIFKEFPTLKPVGIDKKKDQSKKKNKKKKQRGGGKGFGSS